MAVRGRGGRPGVGRVRGTLLGALKRVVSDVSADVSSVSVALASVRRRSSTRPTRATCLCGTPATGPGRPTGGAVTGLTSRVARRRFMAVIGLFSQKRSIKGVRK